MQNDRISINNKISNTEKTP